MGQQQDIVAVAASQVGYKEVGNNNTKYGQWYGMNNNPWCVMFVSWCAAQVGIPVSIIPKLAYVPYMVDFFKKQGRYHQRGTYVPEPGDIIFFGNSDHVGIVEKVTGNTVFTIEGNTSASGNSSNGDGVYRRNRLLNNSWIMGYGSPNYQEGDEDMKRYNSLAEVPKDYRETVDKFMKLGIIKGNGTGLDLSEDMLRMLVFMDRGFGAAKVDL